MTITLTEEELTCLFSAIYVAMAGARSRSDLFRGFDTPDAVPAAERAEAEYRALDSLRTKMIVTL